MSGIKIILLEILYGLLHKKWTLNLGILRLCSESKLRSVMGHYVSTLRRSIELYQNARFERGVIVSLILLSTLSLSAQEPIRITEPEGKVVLGLHTEYMEDKDGKLQFGDVRQIETLCRDAVIDDVLEGVADKSKYEFRFLDTVKVKGKNKAVRIFEILNGVSPRIRDLKLQTKPEFEEGIRLYFDRNFKSALKKMKSVLKKDSKDKAAELYIERCNFYSKNGTDPNWDGIEKLDFK